MELVMKNLTKKYQDVVAVNHLNIKLTSGVYGLLGANGAGKTTWMRMLCTIAFPDEGSILYDGKDIWQMQEDYRDMIGYLPQKFGYYPEFSAYDFMMYMASLKGLKPSYAKKKTKELLTMVGLKDVQKKKIKTYSGGMIQRLGIAQAMLNDPKILILDEPTAGLDPKERVRFRNIISQFAQDRFVLLSTHIVSDVEYIANEILMMKEGSILMRGSVENITAKMQGQVWECHVPVHEVQIYQQRYCISNLRNEGNKVQLRIVSEHAPCEQAYLVEPTLEDVYLYEFKEETVCTR